MNNKLKLMKAHFKLDFPKPMYLMFLLGVLMCAPNYPRMVGIMFVVMIIGSVLGVTRETRSDEMFLTLPVRRADIVKGQALFIAGIQSIYLVSCALFAVVACFIPFFGSTLAAAQVGMLANVGFFGIALGVYGVFNLAFMPLYYFKGKVSPTSLFIACIAAIVSSALFYGIFEFIAQTVPAFGHITRSFGIETLGWQLLMLAAGFALYIFMTWLASLLAVKRYTSKDVK